MEPAQVLGSATDGDALAPRAGQSGDDSPAIPISGRRKAAILLSSLGDEASAAILRHLTEEQVNDLMREIGTLGRFSAQERTSVLKEYLATAGDPIGTSGGGVEYATSVLLAAFGPDTGRRMAERLLRSVGRDGSTTEALRAADPQELAKILQREHPQTLALILCNLDTTKAARLLIELPQAQRGQVVRRVAALDQVSPDVTNRLGKIVGAKLRLSGVSGSESFGGPRAVAELLNRVEPTTAEQILNQITDEDPEMGHAIRQIMFVFEDLLKVSQDSLRRLVGKADRKVLTIALKGSDSDIRKHFASAMSQRSGEMLKEDMEALGPVRIKDVQAARQALVATARAMADAGEISLTSDLEEYVE
jgi:flagellar motor switch protein FliG